MQDGPYYTVDWPVRLSVKAGAHAPAILKFSGAITLASPRRLVCVFDRFEEKYADDLMKEYQYVVARPADDGAIMPDKLAGRVVGLYFREDELPLCRVSLEIEEAPHDFARFLEKIA